MIKNRITRGERSDTYLTHVCSLLRIIEMLERVDKTRASASTVAFIWLKAPVLFSLASISTLCGRLQT